jgi:hypothetical protein
MIDYGDTEDVLERKKDCKNPFQRNEQSSMIRGV